MITVYYTRIDSPFLKDNWDTLLQLLPEQAQRKVMHFRKWEDRYRGLLGKLLLQKALLDINVNSNYSANIQYTSYGRPYLPSGPDFNISHSGDIVVCSCAVHGKTGIDIEQLSSVDLGGFQRMFTRSEWNDIMNAPEQLLRFYHYWTLKESVIKADGRGFFAPLDQLVIEDDKAILEQQKWLVQELYIDTGYKCFISLDIEQEIKLQEIDFAGKDAF